MKERTEDGLTAGKESKDPRRPCVLVDWGDSVLLILPVPSTAIH